jgi:hypothetical protein
MNLYIDGKPITAGTRIKDFRNDSWTFGMVVEAPSPGKSGKVEVMTDAGASRIFYPAVFDGEIR